MGGVVSRRRGVQRPEGRGLQAIYHSPNRVDYAVGVISLAAVMRGHSIPGTGLI